MSAADIATLQRVISKCEEKAKELKRSGSTAQARVADELAASFRSMMSAASKPRCACCGTTKNLHADYGSGGPYRCDSDDCMVF